MIIVMSVASMPFEIETKIINYNINYKNAMKKTKCNIQEIRQYIRRIERFKK